MDKPPSAEAISYTIMETRPPRGIIQKKTIRRYTDLEGWVVSNEVYTKHLRIDRLPHVWCPGCGNGMVLKASLIAIDELKLNPDRISVVSGIGCSSRATGYINFNTLHTLHGRAIPFATGVKFARPDMQVIVMSGDGDLAAIGGNHFIHAARRNMDLCVIGYNNNIYGMTGGQSSPTTPEGSYATTTPYGNAERTFDLAQLAISAGATYVARATTFHFLLLKDYIKKALVSPGFSFVEAITQCPTYFGRYHKMNTGAAMMEYFKASSVNIKKAEQMNPDELKGKIIIGELLQKNIPGYISEYEKIIQKAMAMAE